MTSLSRSKWKESNGRAEAEVPVVEMVVDAPESAIPCRYSMSSQLFDSIKDLILINRYAATCS